MINDKFLSEVATLIKDISNTLDITVVFELTLEHVGKIDYEEDEVESEIKIFLGTNAHYFKLNETDKVLKFLKRTQQFAHRPKSNMMDAQNAIGEQERNKDK